MQCGNDFFLLGVIVETDGAAVFVFAAEYDFGDLVFEMVLYGSFQRSGTELYVISFLCDKVFGCIGELDVVSQGGDAVIEPFELDVDDAEYRLLVELVECNDVVDTVQEFGRECLVERFLNNRPGEFFVAYRAGVESDAASEIFELTGSHVGGHDDDGILKVDFATHAVGNMTFVHDLQQEVEDIGVSFFELIEQYDRVGFAAHLFGQLSAFFISHISRRCTDQS